MIMSSPNKPNDYILAIVEFLGDQNCHVHYARQPFQHEPDCGVTSVTNDFADLLARGESPW